MSYGPNSTFSSGYISYVLYGCPLCRLQGPLCCGWGQLLWVLGRLAPDQLASRPSSSSGAASLWVQSGLDYMVQRNPRPGPAHWYVELGLGYLAAGPRGPRAGAAPLEVGTVTQGGWLHDQEVPGLVLALVNRPKSRLLGYKSSGPMVEA